MKHFNLARHDPLWKEDSIFNMIEIYTGMYDENFGGNERIIDVDSIIVAENLFEELERINHDAPRNKVLKSYFSLRCNTYDAEILMKELVMVLEVDKVV